MTRPSYKGLTWDHPRGYQALEAATAVAQQQGVDIEWDRQPLEGFESHPIAELAERYDLLVLDHPHLGDALAADCLQPLDAVLPDETLSEIAAATVGPCLESYRMGGRIWALPLDAATQVLAYRPDLLDDDPPAAWDQVLAIAERNGLALSLAGPHALLTLMSIATAIGPESSEVLLFDPRSGTEAYAILAQLYRHAVPDTLPLNPIGLLDYMAGHDDVALCPLVFGYVNYTAPPPGRRRIGFADAPHLADGGRPGSILGGTGIGITGHCEVTPELIAHLLWLVSAEAQGTFIPANAGQPSRRDAWTSAAVNADWPDFYRATLATIEAAHVRPRLPGMVPMLLETATLIRAALAEGAAGETVVAAVNARYQRLSSSAKGHER